jgi:hypothetical protein
LLRRALNVAVGLAKMLTRTAPRAGEVLVTVSVVAAVATAGAASAAVSVTTPTTAVFILFTACSGD